MLGIYANDQWTRGRLTLNLGLRFDYKNSSVPAVTQPAGTFLPERTYAAVEDVPNWKDIGPRLGAAYDLFGDGRTALKFAWSRYVGGGNYTGEANFLNPQTAASNSANRAWDDLNGNFIPECDFLLPAANGECRVLQNLNFGVLGELPRAYDPDAVAGWHVRPYNTEMAVTAQHQITSRIGIDAGYYRRSYGNFHVDDNTLIGPQDFDTYCLTTPVDPRLPGGGGQQLCGFGDIKPEKLGPEFTNRTLADKFGKYEDVYDGVDFSVNTRLGAGTVLRGGFSTGRERIDRCFAVDSPEGTSPAYTSGLENARPYPAHPGTTPHLCQTNAPFQTQAKMIASFTLPWEIILAGTLQNSPGPQITATYQVRASQTTLGRLFAGGNANTTKDVEIVAPGIAVRASSESSGHARLQGVSNGAHAPAGQLRPVQYLQRQPRPPAAERLWDGWRDLAAAHARAAGSPGKTGLQLELLRFVMSRATRTLWIARWPTAFVGMRPHLCGRSRRPHRRPGPGLRQARRTAAQRPGACSAQSHPGCGHPQAGTRLPRSDARRGPVARRRHRLDCGQPRILRGRLAAHRTSGSPPSGSLCRPTRRSDPTKKP